MRELTDVPSPGTLIRTRARTFYLASLFLPRQIRRDVHIVYAYFRTIDDLVDEPPQPSTVDEIRERLDIWERTVRSGCQDSALSGALRGVIARHEIPPDLLCMVIDGARFDLELRQIETVEELLRYSVLVAGSVGMVMATLMGARHPEALASARDLGTAMQITNVLRDVGEDLGRGRVYLPRTELECRGCRVDALSRLDDPAAAQVVMQMLAVRARTLYSRGMAGIHFLPSSCQFSIYLAAVLYARILDKIENSEFDVFSSRAHLGTAEKWRAVLPAYVAHRRVRTT